MKKRIVAGMVGLLFGMAACVHTPDALYTKALAATGGERVTYLMRAAERGHAEAQYQLGLLYEYGNGVEKDIARAVEYYQKAAAQGHPQAHATLEINFE